MTLDIINFIQLSPFVFIVSECLRVVTVSVRVLIVGYGKV